jgi:thiol-disulfide isomerase/thioredoxin
MLNFWASWCGPCRIEIPHMIEAYDEYRDEGLEIIAVNLREPPERVQEAVEQFGMPFTVLLDEKGMVGQAYYIRGIPTSLFLNEEGVIETVHVGTLNKETLHRYIAGLLE